MAFDITAVDNLNSVRGVGSYTQNLQGELNKYKDSIGINFVKKGFNPNSYKLVHYPYFDLFFHTLPINSKAKRIVTIHDVIPLIFPDKFPAGIRGHLNLLLQKRALKNVDLVICDSKTSKSDIVNKLSVDSKKVEVIYLAAGSAFTKLKSAKLLETVKSKYRLPDKFCLFVGDVNWNKNIGTLLEAVSISKIPVVLVGNALTDNSLPQTIELNSLINNIGIEKLVTKTSFVPESDLVAIYNLATVTVAPSYYEGFGLPVLESMACGTPVICSDNSSLAEIGVGAAIFCDPSSPQDVAEKIASVVNMNTVQREQLSQKCLKHAAKFSYKKTAELTVAAYQKVLK